jgi:hypothetical protein
MNRKVRLTFCAPSSATTNWLTCGRVRAVLSSRIISGKLEGPEDPAYGPHQLLEREERVQAKRIPVVPRCAAVSAQLVSQVKYV